MRIATPNSRTGPISPGYFHQGLQYSTWRPKGSGDWLLIFTVGGAGKILHQSGALSTAIGDALLYEPGTRQDYRTDPGNGAWALHWAHFLPRAHWEPWLREFPRPAPGIRLLALPDGEARRQVERALKRMLGAWRGTLFNREDFAMAALESALLWMRTVLSRDPWPGLDPRIRESMRHMEQHLESPLSLGALARSSNLSVSRFAHLFRQETGTTPQRFQESLRMNKARQLLENTSMRISEVAAETGYDDPLYFSNRFKRWSGHSPSAYRERILPRA